MEKNSLILFAFIGALFLCNVQKVMGIAVAEASVKFTKDAALDGWTCPAKDTISITENIESKMQCTRQCSEITSCVGCFYRLRNKTCVYCSSTSMSDAEPLEGTLFYKRESMFPSETTATATDVISTAVTTIPASTAESSSPSETIATATDVTSNAVTTIPASTVESSSASEISATATDVISTAVTTISTSTVEIRLTSTVDSGDYVSGYLEMFLQKEWVGVCNNGWNWKATNVACKQLDERFLYGGTYHKNWLSGDTMSVKPPGYIEYNNLNCTGSEDNLSGCALMLTTTPCSQDDELALSCFTYNFSSGLNVAVGKNSEQLDGNADTGLVWVKINETWGAICADVEWTNVQGGVTCRTVNPVWRIDYVKTTTEPGYLYHTRNLECHGDEPHLFNCQNEGWNIKGKVNCTTENMILIDCD